MGKFVISYAIVFIMFTIFSSILDGGGGMAATRLTANIDNNDTRIYADTTGFLEADVIFIQGEEIPYSSKTATYFDNCLRGYNATDAASHSKGDTAYTRGSDILNSAFGFNIISTGEAYGTMGIINIGLRFLGRGVGALGTFNFSFLNNGSWVYFRYIGMAIGLGLLVVFAIIALGTAFGIINK